MEKVNVISDGCCTNSFGLNRVAFGNRYVSHMVYIGNESLSDLLESQKGVISSDEFAKFSSEVKGIRENVNVELVQLVKFYNGK